MKKVLLTILVLTILFCIPAINAFATEEPASCEVMTIEEQTPDDSGSCGDNVTWEYYASTNTLVIKGQGDMQSSRWTSPYTTIKNAIVEEGVTSLSERTFYNCSSLQSVTLPQGLKKIGTYSFYSCKKLTQIEIPSSVEVIERYAFSTCTRLATVELSEGLEKIGERAFYNCSALKSIEIPKSVVTIDRYAFNKCKALNDLTISQGVQTIGLQAFSECAALESIYIPKSVTTIGESAFTDCTKLANITVDEENPNYSSQDNVLYNKDKTRLITYPIGKTNTEFVLPETVISIDDFAFQRCTNLTKITFPQILKTIGEWSFAYCTNLAEIKIFSGLESIDSWSFAYCSNLTQINLPETMTVIGYGSFAHCAELKSLHIPASVENIEEYIITDCKSLATITVDKENQNYCAQDSVIYNKDKTEILHYAQAKPDTEFTVPDTVKIVGKAAFEHSKNLKKIILQQGVEQILTDAFLECTALEEIVIPNSLASVGEYAFQNCSALKTICYDGDATSWKKISITETGNNKFTGAKILYAHTVTFTGDVEATQKVYTSRFAQPCYVADYGYKYVYTVDGAQWDFNSAITKDIVVNVQTQEVPVIHSNVYNISGWKYISKIEPNTTVGEFLSNITEQNVKVFKKASAERELANTANIGTGCIARLYDEKGEAVFELMIVILGDISGDGRITTPDLTLIKANISGTRDFTEDQMISANIAQPSKMVINTSDLTYLKGVIAGTRTITQA